MLGVASDSSRDQTRFARRRAKSAPPEASEAGYRSLTGVTAKKRSLCNWMPSPSAQRHRRPGHRFEGMPPRSSLEREPRTRCDNPHSHAAGRRERWEMAVGACHRDRGGDGWKASVVGDRAGMTGGHICRRRSGLGSDGSSSCRSSAGGFGYHSTSS